MIFFLQTTHNFPTAEQTSAQVCSADLDFKTVLEEFFFFYGNRYQIWNHVISIHIGRWQERRLQPEQKSFTPAQQRYVNEVTSIIQITD